MNNELNTRFEEHMEDTYGPIVDQYIRENDIKDFSWLANYDNFITWLDNILKDS